MNLVASIGPFNQYYLTVWDASISSSSNSSGSSSSVTTAVSPNSFTGILSLLGIVAFLGVLMYFAYKFSKHMSKRSSAKSLYGNYIEIVERVVIGQDRLLYIIRLKERVLLIGVTSNQITKLEELDPGDYPQKRSEEQARPESFSSLFRDMMGKPKASGSKSNSEDKSDE